MADLVSSLNVQVFGVSWTIFPVVGVTLEKDLRLRMAVEVSCLVTLMSLILYLIYTIYDCNKGPLRDLKQESQTEFRQE